LVKAPAGKEASPFPFSVIGSAVLSEIPLISNTAPEATTVPAAIVPSGVLVALPAAPSFKVPALMVVVPEYELKPESVQVPVPSLVTARAPLIADVKLPPADPPRVIVVVPVAGVPDIVIEPASPTILALAAKVITPAYSLAATELLVKAPRFENPVPEMLRGSEAEPVNENPFISRVAPRATVVPAAEPKGPDVAEEEDAPSFRIPALILVVPT